MIPIISIVGKSNSGKTTLIEKLIPLLKARGYRICTIKHDTHGFDIDREGKDTWRHAQAGAAGVIISSPFKIAMIKQVERERSLDELAELFGPDVDLILTEGFKRGKKPKIEVSRSEVPGELICDTNDNLVAIASNHDWDRGVPCFNINDAEALAEFIEKNFLFPSKPSVK
ncbi:MAG: molybdopterin-guanine dinucleotide biosynthesis protein B [Candidatus Tectomicrobia bacterium]|uniref:Molybdopterin-guanine dinucleotide biosynthesis protein B n=1 Tax=Tectimicrobiota bacterium TaxID=2528274 RepID=A0A933GKI7_UNCTE|nr:molybdopterin-guanine dinucleotide biosynthesis protein B [Candidatus Tectomicrobia bacterium]